MTIHEAILASLDAQTLATFTALNLAADSELGGPDCQTPDQWRDAFTTVLNVAEAMADVVNRGMVGPRTEAHIVDRLDLVLAMMGRGAVGELVDDLIRVQPDGVPSPFAELFGYRDRREAA